MSENTISSTRLLSLIVVMSVVALSFVLCGGNHKNTKQTSVTSKPADLVVYTSDTLYKKMPVKKTTVKFSVNPGAVVLSI